MIKPPRTTSYIDHLHPLAPSGEHFSNLILTDPNGRSKENTSASCQGRQQILIDFDSIWLHSLSVGTLV